MSILHLYAADSAKSIGKVHREQTAGLGGEPKGRRGGRKTAGPLGVCPGREGYFTQSMPASNALKFRGTNLALAPVNISSIMVRMVSGFSALVAAT